MSGEMLVVGGELQGEHLVLNQTIAPARHRSGSRRLLPEPITIHYDLGRDLTTTADIGPS